jgi:glycerol-1-phosphate dehydrogenase [NAD(P)+]
MHLNSETIKTMEIQNYLGREFQCHCGKRHIAEIDEVVVESNALSKLPALIKKYGYKKVFIVSDTNTYKVAGHKVEVVLSETGLPYKKHVFSPKDDLVPDEAALGRLFIEIEKETDLILGVGSGTINDLCRFLSYRLDIPYFIAATAPSMDGYASTVSPLIVNNLKVTYNAVSPKAIIADVDIIKNAPMTMILAGLGDILGKYTSLCDWKLGKIINKEYFCETIEGMTLNSLEKCVSNIEGIKKRENTAIKNLMEGLVLSGIAMSFAGNSRPASGSEHHMSHFWEMMFLLQGKPAVLHGIKVGITATASARVYHTVINENIDFDNALEKAQSFDKEAWIKYIEEVYKEAAEDIVKQIVVDSPQSYLLESKIRRIESIRDNWEEIVHTVKQSVPEADILRSMLRDCGAPVKPFDIAVDENMVLESIRTAKDLRPRYTVLQLAEDLGLLEKLSVKVKEYLCYI